MSSLCFYILYFNNAVSSQDSMQDFVTHVTSDENAKCLHLSHHSQHTNPNKRHTTTCPLDNGRLRTTHRLRRLDRNEPAWRRMRWSPPLPIPFSSAAPDPAASPPGRVRVRRSGTDQDGRGFRAVPDKRRALRLVPSPSCWSRRRGRR